MSVARPPILLLAALAVVVGLAACGSDVPEATGPSTPATGTSTGTATTVAAADPAALPDGTDAVVTAHVDGDTLMVDDGERVRLIGVDTPETHHPDMGVECFGQAASDHTAELVPVGTPVRLVFDVEHLDRYGRTLAYVYRASDGLFVNAAVADGFAAVLTVPPNVAHADDFLALQRTARSAEAGLWASCPASRLVVEAGAAVDDATASDPSSCDPSYPDVCIPPAPPDLDCADVPVHAFRVLAPDPHHFDVDGDGLGCTS